MPSYEPIETIVEARWRAIRDNLGRPHPDHPIPTITLFIHARLYVFTTDIIRFVVAEDGVIIAGDAHKVLHQDEDRLAVATDHGDAIMGGAMNRFNKRPWHCSRFWNHRGGPMNRGRAQQFLESLSTWKDFIGDEPFQWDRF